MYVYIYVTYICVDIICVYIYMCVCDFYMYIHLHFLKGENHTKKDDLDWRKKMLGLSRCNLMRLKLLKSSCHSTPQSQKRWTRKSPPK